MWSEKPEETAPPAAIGAQAVDLPTDQLTWRCEQAIRNCDPCISCAMHFLKLEVERE